jgi:hypothetical protein
MVGQLALAASSGLRFLVVSWPCLILSCLIQGCAASALRVVVAVSILNFGKGASQHSSGGHDWFTVLVLKFPGQPANVSVTCCSVFDINDAVKSSPACLSGFSSRLDPSNDGRGAAGVVQA